jgi:uncharacterized repeat protein (TIGR01451 family)
MRERPAGPALKLKWGRCAALLMVLLLYASPFAAAQPANDRPPLTLSKVAASELTAAGDTLTYLLTLTNTGQLPLEGVVVEDTTPEGTTCFGVSGPPGWAMTTPGKGRPGRVAWRAESPLSPGEVATLRFIVAIAPDATGQIVNSEYEARVEGWAEPVTGPPVFTAIATPTPARTQPPLPTETPTETPVAVATAPPDATPGQVQAPTEVPASSPTAVSSPERVEVDAGGATTILIAIAALIVALAVALFAIRQKTRA